jgi:8-oxo-dGTP pyrophosphatase MutT (NUDIX family)
MLDKAMADTVFSSSGTDSQWFRQIAAARLLRRPAAVSEAETSPSDFDLNPDVTPPGSDTLKPAVVLVPVIARDVLTVLLTERTQHLSAHAGQIAFPGGRPEAGDRDPFATALRETEEEIGLDPALVEPLGYVEPYRTGTGFLITPVVALVAPYPALELNQDEVADAFEVPFAFLMDAANHRIEQKFWRGGDRRFYAMPYEDRYIWGATAGILRALYRRLFSA